MADWTARVEVDQALTLRQVEQLHEHTAAVVTTDGDRHRTGLRFEVSAGSLRQASDKAIREAGAAVTAAGVSAVPVRVEVMPLGDLAYLLPTDLVTYVEIAEILGGDQPLSRQRVRELDGVATRRDPHTGETVPIARHPDFPHAVVRGHGVALFDRTEIQAFADSWERRVGRPPKGERSST